MNAIFFGFCRANPMIGPDLIVVDAVDQRYNQDDLHAGAVKIFDRAQFHIKQVADLAMAVGVVADAVKLQVRIAKSGFRRFLCKFLLLANRCRWLQPERCCIPLCAHSEPPR